MLFAWHPQGSFLATCGQNRIVNIFNRQGEPHAEIPLEGTGCASPSSSCRTLPRRPKHTPCLWHGEPPGARPRRLTASACARSKCLQLGWDRDGELLAVLQKDSAVIKLWVRRARGGRVMECVNRLWCRR